MGGSGGTDARSPSALFDVGSIPRPLLALFVSSISTVVGLGFFKLLSTRALGLSITGRMSTVAVLRERSGRQAPLDDAAFAASPAAEPASARTQQVDPAWGGSIREQELRFSAPPEPGIDRCRVVSRLVPLRTEPDEFSPSYAERLDVGDEVDVLRQEGPYCLVRTPSGLEGWVPGLALTGTGRTGTGGTAPEATSDER